MVSMTLEAIAEPNVPLDMAVTTMILTFASHVMKSAQPVKMKTKNTA